MKKTWKVIINFFKKLFKRKPKYVSVVELPDTHIKTIETNENGGNE